MEKLCPVCLQKYPAEEMLCPVDGANLVLTSVELKPGDVIEARYTVLERLGEGGMGVVYRAEQHLLKRQVALKVLRPDMSIKDDAVRRFLTEAQAIASLNSQHTVTLYDFGVMKGGALYYTMELLQGEVLASLMRRLGPMPLVQALKLVLQVCDSLEEAHERGILHRDIKPENLFVLQRDDEDFVKVVDFGIAKIGESTVSDSVTRAGAIVGTPQYLSPEQALGDHVGPMADIYSLAVVLYEMLAGRNPFLRDTPFKTMLAHIQDEVPPVHATTPLVKVPPYVTALLVKALEKAPEQRFHSAAAFRDAVSRCLDQYVSDMGLAAGARGDLDQEPAAPATAQKVRIANQAFVCPQPVVLVGTHVNGVPNYTTISWASRVSYSPALMAITVGKKHHSNMGIRQTGEFTVNTPSVDLIQQVDFCGIFSGETTDKSTRFTPFYGFLKNAPMIKECALSLECKVVDIISLYGYDMFIGEIVGVYSEERYLTDDKPDMAKMRPLALSTPDTKYWSMGQPIGAAWKIGRDLK